MPEINGTQNNSLQNMLESLNSSFAKNNSTQSGTNNTTNFAPNKETTNAVLEELLKRVNTIGTNSANPTNSAETVNSMPATPAPPKKKKKKRGFFSKIGKALKGVGKFLKKALPIISTVAMFIPGIGTAIGGALKIATAAMGAFDAIKSKNPLGFISSVAGAFTGGASNLLGKAQSFLGNSGIGSFVSKGLDFFSKAKDTFSNFTAGLGGKVTNWLSSNGSNLFSSLTKGIGGKVGEFLTQKGPDWIKNLANNAGSKVTNWLNEKASNLFSKVTQNPTFQKVSNFFNTTLGNTTIGQTLLDLFAAKKG